MKFLKIVFLFMLLAGVAHGQSTSDWKTVVTEGTGLYTNGAPLGSEIGFYKPSFASLKVNVTPVIVATNVAVTNGTITSGTITNTWVEDGSYLVIQETGVFEVYLTYTNAGKIPQLFDFHGRYEGNPSHNIKFAAYDYIDGAYEDFTAAADDLPSSGTDSTLEFIYPDPKTNFINASGESVVRIIHDGSAVASHDLYIDYTANIYPSVVLETGGLWYAFMNVEVQHTNNMAASATDATITTTSEGDYKREWYLAFTGSTNTTFEIRHLTNGAPTSTTSIRTIGDKSSVGSMNAFGYGRQASGITNSWQVRANTDNAWIAIINGAASIEKKSD